MYTYQITDIPLNTNDPDIVTIGVTLVSDDSINPNEDEKKYSLSADQATPENFHAAIQVDVDKLNNALQVQTDLAKAFTKAGTVCSADVDMLASIAAS